MKMPETITSARRFQNLVQKLLEAKGFDPQESETSAADEGFDFLAKLARETWVIDIKYYRSQRAQTALLDAAASRLIAIGIPAHAQKGMLVVSCSLGPAMRQALEARHSLSFVDRADLFAWAADAPQLLDELEALLEADSPTPSEQQAPRPATVEGKPLPENPPAEDRVGGELCEELQALKRGRAKWAAYEKLCDRVLHYLFPNDLHGWHKQRRTDDGLNRFDYVCRIRQTTDFWRFLIDHLDSRYVLFEFKNYEKKIKQGQILTTEKYLLEKGLRRVAIIVTRSGADKDAIAMTQGAMRQSGKLMLVLDDQQVCKMLRMKERGADPSDHLFDLTDDFLLSLPR
jgi:hypothetical protein